MVRKRTRQAEDNDHDDDEQADENLPSSSSSSSTFDANLFEKLVHVAVRCIPKGKVTTYGHIAKLCHHPKHARAVGKALGRLPVNTDVPWQRVINASFTISPRGDGGIGAQAQANRLREEGIAVVQDAMGTWKIPKTNQWETQAEHLDQLLLGKNKNKKKKSKTPGDSGGGGGGGDDGVQVKMEEEEEEEAAGREKKKKKT